MIQDREPLSVCTANKREMFDNDLLQKIDWDPFGFPTKPILTQEVYE